MDRQSALAAVEANVKNRNLIKHMLATEAVMRALARRMGGDEEEWALAGLLHDIDVELTNGDMSRHSRTGAEMARQLGAGEAVVKAILCHNEAHGIKPETDIEKALFCTDPLTGLITAVALVRPDKKLASVEPKSVTKRFKEARFAAGVNRNIIDTCTNIGLTREEFVAIGLDAMKGIAGELGL